MHDVIRLDADNKAGLKSKYEHRFLMLEAQELYAGNKLAAAIAACEKALAVSGITEEEISQSVLVKCYSLMAMKEYQAAIDCATPRLNSSDGLMTSSLNGIISRAKTMLRSKTGSKDELAQPNPKSTAVKSGKDNP